MNRHTSIKPKRSSAKTSKFTRIPDAVVTSSSDNLDDLDSTPGRMDHGQRHDKNIEAEERRPKFPKHAEQ